MRRLSLTLIAVASIAPAGSGGIADRPVRIYFTGPETLGQSVPLARILTILFVNAPCPLPIVGAERMRRLWQQQGAYQIGCWYPTIPHGFTTIDGLGHIHANDVPWQAFPRALLHAANSATITEPGFDHIDAFLNRVASAILMAEIRDHQHERP
jgi:hypothetical protein